ncbi:MAG: hypothetical protein R6U44_00630 [Archaeoglobaceae archaeon]
MEHLLILNYDSDAERKRFDYATERWKNKIKIKKPRGALVILDGDDNEISKFVEDIFSRIELEPDENPSDKVKIYKLEEYEPEVGKKTKRLSYESKEDEKTINRFVDYLMAKLNGSYEYSTGTAKIYTVYTKKGQARLEYNISKKELTRAVISIEGYGEVVDFIAKKVDDEIGTFLGG